MSSYGHRIMRPILDENPITVQILGLCSALAVSSSLRPALIMATAVFFVLTFSNVAISCLRHVMPKSIRLIIEVIIIASAVILVDEFLKAFAPDASRTLSVFVGLIITNCIVLGRAESFALHNPVRDSLADAIGNATGYAVILIIVASIREFLGAGSILDYPVLPADIPKNAMMATAPSAFFIIGLLIWGIRSFSTSRRNSTRRTIAQRARPG